MDLALGETGLIGNHWVAGVDGCRAGWVVALRRADDPSDVSVRICTTFADVLALPEAPVLIAVDIPIGLADVAAVGGRTADIEARRRLGARRTAVFAMPARAAVMETDYRRACTVAQRTSVPPRMISKQAFYLFPKIREVDALMSPGLQDRVVECHPELAFWALNGCRPVALAKKGKTRAETAGLELRRDLLAAAGYKRAVLDAAHFKAREAGADDSLDALANSWSAARITHGQGQRFPAEPEVDARGLRMEIWC